jgi:tetratricopeptide (TPR) repeat protein
MTKAVQSGDRTLALIYADQDRHLDRALSLAEKELESRRDVYTYDALAWALYKNKRYADAEAAIAKAMSMGTPEPMFFYHAGMIAYASGKKQDAEKLLKKALELNPKFHPRQAKMAETTLAAVAGE